MRGKRIVVALGKAMLHNAVALLANGVFLQGYRVLILGYGVGPVSHLPTEAYAVGLVGACAVAGLAPARTSFAPNLWQSASMLPVVAPLAYFHFWGTTSVLVVIAASITTYWLVRAAREGLADRTQR